MYKAIIVIKHENICILLLNDYFCSKLLFMLLLVLVIFLNKVSYKSLISMSHVKSAN